MLAEMSARGKGLVVVFIALLAWCGGRESTNATEIGDHRTQPDGGVTAADSSAQGGDGAQDDWFACSRSTDCILIPASGCCGACHPMSIAESVAISLKHASAFRASKGCAGVDCEACPALGPDPQIESNFLALCDAGRCSAVDLRFSKYAACSSTADCVLQWGFGCCEGCDDSEVVALNPAAGLSAELCPVAAPCVPPSPGCLARRNPLRAAECTGAHLCQLSD